MKILFVGIFSNLWSTTIPMALELKKQNHKVICFDFRIGIKHYNWFIYNKIISLVKRYKNYPFFKLILGIDRFYLHGNWKINRQLLKEVKATHYDLIFLAKTPNINFKTITRINKYSNTFYFFMDPISKALKINGPKYASLTTWSSATFSSVNNLFKRTGANSIFLTQGYDTRLFNPSYNNIKKDIDVIFIGSVSLKRKNYINFLKENKINIECHGFGWKNGPIYLKKLVSKYRHSKIILNFTRGKIGFSIRVFQSMGCGSFLLSEYCEDLRKIFKERTHLESFKDQKELLNLIKYYLKNDDQREFIAKQGQKFVRENFSWEIIMKKIIQLCKN